MSDSTSPNASAEGIELIDLMHLGRPSAIGAWVLGDVIVDPGPASCLPRAAGGARGREPRVLALTHIHLDHAGAAGTLARRFPGLRVWVHERGRRHLADPSRLLASATRLYGDQMERLWGEVLPVPPSGSTCCTGARRARGCESPTPPATPPTTSATCRRAPAGRSRATSPGSASTAGPTLAPTPPPDIDLPAWRASIERSRRLVATRARDHPLRLLRRPAAQLADLREYLDEVESLAARLDEQAFAAAVRSACARAAAARSPTPTVRRRPCAQSYAGLRRYLEREQTRR